MKKSICIILLPYSSLKKPYYQHKPIKNINRLINSNTIIKNYSTNNLLLRKPASGNWPHFPYGQHDFAFIRKNKQYYVDKTHFIPLLEQKGQQLFFVRPPRWGKSLLLSMLFSYYNINMKDEFDEIFSGLWIGHQENWTPEKNQYHVLKFDFSISTDGTPEDIRSSLHTNINTTTKEFLEYYGLSSDVDINENDSFDTYRRLVLVLARKKLRLMVLIDEYDRFANKLMFENPEKYRLLVQGKRGDPTSSPIRTFFEQLKWSSGAGLKSFRSIITGVTPIALDAPGYNVSKNISFDPTFGDLVGLNEADLRKALENINIIGTDQDTTISTMKKNYNGYHFPGSIHALFNPTLSMFFLDRLSIPPFKDAILNNQSTKLTDANTEISENVFATLARSTAFGDIILQLLSKDSIEVFDSIYPSVKLRDIIDPPPNEGDTPRIFDNVLSFMYYHGMITFTEESSKQIIPKQLVIPSEVARVQYLKRLQSLIPLVQSDVSTLINQPTQDNLKKLLNNILEKQETIYDNSLSEGGLQASIEAVLRAYSLFGKHWSQQFSIHAEREYSVSSNNMKYIKRADLVIRTSQKVLIIEFKRIRPNFIAKYCDIEDWYPQIFKNVFNDLSKYTDEELLEMEVFTYDKQKVSVRSILNSAISQVKQYAKYENNIDSSKDVLKFVVIQVGWPIIVRKLN